MLNIQKKQIKYTYKYILSALGEVVLITISNFLDLGAVVRYFLISLLPAVVFAWERPLLPVKT